MDKSNGKVTGSILGSVSAIIVFIYVYNTILIDNLNFVVMNMHRPNLGKLG